MNQSFHQFQQETAFENSKLLIIADDFAMSEGTNKAIIELAASGHLKGASVMTTTQHFLAVEELKKIRDEANKNWDKNKESRGFLLGLHLDLTYGKCNSRQQSRILANNTEIFRFSFFGLFWRSFFQKKNLLRSVFYEANAQFKKLEDAVGMVDYIDGHQHIHSIPLIFSVVMRIAKRKNIKRIRIINECFPSFFSLFSIFISSPKQCFIGLIKLSVLRFCFLINQIKFQNDSLASSSRYFFSIIYSCRFNEKAKKALLKLIKKGEKVELMVHPGYSAIDISDQKNREFRHLTSKFRNIEREQVISLFSRSS